MDHTIELRKVSKYYAGESGVSMGFARVDLTLDMGEFVAITGESGSGKSTLLNVISGLDTYDEGEMFVCGEDTTAFQTEEYEKYRKTYIGNIFQDFNLVNSYSVYQNIELVMLMCGKKASECKARIEELIDLVGLSEYKKTKASRLSGGQKQRVAIARALAKDAPIIVADEPTGNLDSESANLVMETLSKVSKDKLVVIVTHNYEQAEPYVTRKLTMHDGRIIEDKKFVRTAEAEAPSTHVAHEAESMAPAENSGESVKDTENVESDKLATDDMTRGSELRLGLRNTFNLPAKFILLFIVYLFVSTAVLGQYASAKNSQHATDILGYNPYLMDTSAERVLVTKPDRSTFSEEDITKLSKIKNIKNVVTSDLGIDQMIMFELKDYSVDTTTYPVSMLDKADLTYGRMPESDNEVVLYSNTSSVDLEYIKGLGEGTVGQTGRLSVGDAYGAKLLDDTLTVVGVVLDETSADLSWGGTSRLYMTDNECNKLRTRQIAYCCTTTTDFNGNSYVYEGGMIIMPSSKVPSGKAYISEDLSMNYASEKVVGKPLTISVKSSFFSDSLGVSVGKVFTKKSIASDLGISKDNYDDVSSKIFINSSDFDAFYNKGTYQVSVYMADETAFKTTGEAIEAAGFKAFFVKDSLTDITGGFNFVITLLSYGSLIIEFIVLFFIAYAVIRLIMKSRNSYYSTLRILGANKKNTDMILRIELLLMMVIAYVVDLILVVLVNYDVIDYAPIKSQLNFLTPLDYVILLAGLLCLSLLIARRYSRKIFTKSAMTAYRGEV